MTKYTTKVTSYKQPPILTSFPTWVCGVTTRSEDQRKIKEQMLREKVKLTLGMDVSGGD